MEGNKIKDKESLSCFNIEQIMVEKVKAKLLFSNDILKFDWLFFHFDLNVQNNLQDERERNKKNLIFNSTTGEHFALVIERKMSYACGLGVKGIINKKDNT